MECNLESCKKMTWKYILTQLVSQVVTDDFFNKLEIEQAQLACNHDLKSNIGILHVD